MKPIRPFKLERYFAEHEFSAKHLLSSSDCDGWGMSDLLAGADAETKALWDGLKLGYTESRGLPLLRREIAGLYRGVDPDHVLVGAPQELIALAMQALLAPGDHVVCAFPAYQSLYELARSIGCQVDYWRPVERGGWRFEPESLAALMKPATKLVIANFPHNPTGAFPSQAGFERVVELVASRGARLFSDEMYRWLEHDPKDRLAAACELSGRAVSLSGMSKSFGMAGVRVGWLVVKEKPVYDRLCELKDYTTICSAAPSEVLAVMGLRAKERILAAHRARLRRNLDLLDVFFGARAGSFTWSRPRAGTVGFAGYLRPEPVQAFCDRAVREAGVMVLPSTAYDYEPPHVRVGFGRENFPEALEAFGRFLDR